MKKQLFFLSILLSLIVKINAQSIQIIDTSGTASVAQPSYTISVDADSSNARLFWVKNVTSSPVNIQLKSYVVSNLGGDLISYCIGTQCHSAGQPTTANTSISANGTLASNGLLLDFTDFAGSGYSQVLYTLFNAAHPTSDSVSLLVTYKIFTAGIKQNISNYMVADIAPNPASNIVSLSYDLKDNLQTATIKIYNMLGTLVKSVALNTYDNNTKMDISSLEEGLYFYSVVLNGKILKTSRLVISR